VEDENLLAEFESNDPALRIGNTYEIYPISAIRR
jgi:hypothetical protein